MDSLPYLSIPGLLFLLLMCRAVPLGNPNFSHGRSTAQWRSLGDQAGPLVLITVIVVLRSVSGLGFGTFLTLMAQERGLGLVAGGIPLGIYNIAGVVGALIVGYLADRIDPKPLVWGSLLCSVPPLFAFIYVEGMLASYTLLFLGGGLLLSSNSIMVAMAQEFAPKNTGLVSSLPLGFSWGLASLALPLIGHFGDQIGVAETLKYLALLPILPAGLAFFLPNRSTAKDATL